jgi:RNA polymerase sigma factor (sigma-70 family)
VQRVNHLVPEVPMQSHQTTHHLRQVRSWLAVQAQVSLADPELLERFCRDRNEAAFAVLLERHGPLVLRVCSRQLDDGHAVEDAFQATFLALARKAECIRKSTSLAAWLHGVACRVARRMRDRARRTFPAAALEPVADNDPAAEVTRRELGRALHEEIDRLPERYRLVTLLCCVEGTTRDEAARRLGVPAAAVKKCLEVARGLLRQRLTGRGIVPSATLLAALLEETVKAPAVRANLLQGTLAAAVSFHGNGMAAGAGSAGAVAAAQETMWTMSLVKGKVLLVVLTLALLGSAASVLALTGRNGVPTDDPRSQAASAPTEPGAEFRDATPLPAGATSRLGTAHWQQPGDVFFIAFRRQDNQLVTARQGSAHCTNCHRNPFGDDQDGVEGMVRVWDLHSAKVTRQLGKLAASHKVGLIIGEDGDVRVVRNDPGLPAVSVADSPAGDLLAQTGPNGPIVHWDLTTGNRKELGQADSGAGFVGLAFSPNGKLLASLGARGRVALYDLVAGKEAPGGIAAEAGRLVGWGDAVVFSPDGKLLATTGSVRAGGVVTGVLDVWERGTGKRTLQLIGRARGSPAVGFSPDGRQLAWSHKDGKLRLTDVATGKEARTMGEPEQTRYLAALAFSPDGKRLATRGYDRAVRLWDVVNGQQVRQLIPAQLGQQLAGRTLFGAAGAVPAGSLAFTHDGKLLAAAGPGGAVTFWDGVTGREVMPGHKGPLTGAVFAADGKVLYSLGEDGTVRQWDLAAGRQQQSTLLPTDAHRVALAPDGRAVVFRTNAKSLAVWDLAAGTTRAQVSDLERSKTGCPGCDPPGGLCLSADGKLLARIGAAGAVGVWEIPSGRSRWTRDDAARAGTVPLFGQTLQDLVFAADGRRLAALQGGPSQKDPPVASVFLWDTGRGKLLRQLDGLQGLSGLVVLAPDGRTLATCRQDGTAALWEIATGKERMRLRTGVAGPLTALAYSPDSELIIAAGPEQTLWCWDAVTGQRLGQRRGDQADVNVLAFAPDGHKLVSGGRDGTLLLWDVANFHQEKRPPAPKLEPGEQRQCWDDLASTDAARAARALTRLQAAPLEAVALVRRQVRHVALIAPEILERLIKDLDSADFTRRQQATMALAKLGHLAEPALKKVLEDRPSVESRRRIEGLLDMLPTDEPASVDELRGLRAVELLERLAHPAADALLQRLSEGAGGARLTREARAALQRRQSRAGR